MSSHFRDKNTRRVFLCASAAVGMTLGCVANTSGSDPETFGSVSAGNVSNLPVGTLRVLAGAPAFIGRDAGGLYAMTSTCTHAGCDMAVDGNVTSSGVLCGCHGSRFDANGDVVSGPANAPLAHFAVAIDAAGNVTVDGGSKVSASTRTAVS
ncbi:MAG TPA: Rieske (2Fe-2S) protein [Polyangiaceae bacterium]|nr:Rieske (2Fe-2S) protein [Polyangiaceae bacterium]